MTRSEVAPYLGRFKLTKPLSSKLITGAYVARYNEFGAPEGTLAIYAYSEDGRPATWVGTTYEYHALKGSMAIDVISPDNQVIFARMKLHRLSDGRLTGDLEELRPKAPPQRLTLVPVKRPSAVPRTRSSAGAAATGSLRSEAAGIFSPVYLAARRLAAAPEAKSG